MVDFDIARGLAITIEARKASFLSGYMEVGISKLCESGLDYVEARDVVFGKQKIITVYGYGDFVLSNDNWEVPDSKKYYQHMARVLNGIIQKDVADNENELVGVFEGIINVHERNGAVVVGKSLMRNTMGTITMFNDLMDTRRDWMENKIVVDEIEWL